MNWIVKREQRNRAFSTHWVRNGERSVRRAPNQCPTNADFPRRTHIGSRATLFVSRVSNIAQNCPSLTVRNNRDRPTLSAHTSRKLDNCGVSTGDIHENPTTIIHHGGDIAA
jgi:hypothetical protein